MPSYIYVPVPTPGLLKVAQGLEEKLAQQLPGTCRGTRRNNALKGLGKWKNRVFSGCLKGIGATDTIYVVIHGTGLSGMEKVGGDRNAESEKLSETRQDNLLRPLEMVQDLKVEGPPSAFKTYTAKALAVTMQKEGLSKSHRLIELLACGAGFSDSVAGRQQEIAIKTTAVRGAFSSQIESAHPKQRAEFQSRAESRVEASVGKIAARHRQMDDRPNLKVAFGERFYDALLAMGYAGIRVHAYKGDIKGVATPLDGHSAQPFSVQTSHLTNTGGTYHPDHADLRVTYGGRTN